MSAAEPVDGRHQRSARSREAVVDAVLALLREQGTPPGAQAVADLAGVSLRTVFRHFEDVDSLIATAVEHQLRHVRDRFAPRGTMTVDELVSHRAALFEDIAPVRRAALLREGNDAVRSGLAWAHSQLRAQVAEAFGIGGLTLDAVDAATSWACWDALRREQGLSVRDARGVMSHTVAKLLEV